MSEWKEYKLGDVLEIKYGKDHKSLADGNIPCLGSGGIMRYVERPIYEKESILIPRKGSLNNIIYQNVPFWTVDTMFWSKINQCTVNGKFLFYQLTLIDYTNLNVGSAVPSLTVPVINDIEISLPSLTEQTAIASVLSSLDDKIDLLHRQNTTLEKMAETLFRQWFVEEAKEEWEVEELKKYVRTVDNRGKTPPNSETQTEYPLIEANAINGDSRLINYSVIKKYITEDIFNNWFRNKLSKFDTVITTVGANIGAMAMFVLERGNIAQNIIGLSANGISPFYLYQLLKFKGDEIFQMDIGGVQPSLKVPHILSIKLPIPSIDLQNKFDNHMLGIVSKMEINYKQINTLTQTRETLLPKLMNGEITVE